VGSEIFLMLLCYSLDMDEVFF